MEKQILTTKEAAKFLSISRDQLYKLTGARKVPFYSPTGGKIYFLRSDLEEWILAARKQTIKDLSRASVIQLNNKTSKL
jgi:excisionase family DNA binding protein